MNDDTLEGVPLSTYRSQMLDLGFKPEMLDARIVVDPADLKFGDEITAHLWDSWSSKEWTVAYKTDDTVSLDDGMRDDPVTTTAPGRADTTSKHWCPEIAWYDTEHHRFQFLALRDDDRELSADHGTVLDDLARQLHEAREVTTGTAEIRLRNVGRSYIIPGNPTPVDDVPGGVTINIGWGSGRGVDALGWLRERYKNDEEYVPYEDTNQYTHGGRWRTEPRLYRDNLPASAVVGTLTDDEAKTAIEQRYDLTPAEIISTRRYESGDIRVDCGVEVWSTDDIVTRRITVDTYHGMATDISEWDTEVDR